MTKKNSAKKAIALHKKLGGKISITPTMPVKDKTELSLIYTPGVAAVSSLLVKKPADSRKYTIKGKMIAVVSDGSAVLGLGNIGPYGALPVMEGKCALFKTFANVDAFPITLATQDPQEIIETIERIAPVFGGINLEDIAAPKCFHIESELQKRLEIPVMHDDQHGTAIAVLAALINASKVVKKDLKKLRIVVSGAGAAGTAVTKLLLYSGMRDIIVLDSRGIVEGSRTDAHKKEIAKKTNPRKVTGGLREALRGADVLIGVSGPRLATRDDITLMATRSIIFAMANPVPEIMPKEARRGGAVVIGTGRSDYPNQINNSLVFPGVFRGALDNRVRMISDTMKIKAAKNLAALVRHPTANKIVPGPFDVRVAEAVAAAIR